MGPTNGGVRTISQQAFDDLVRENMEDLGMDPDEALQDAIDTLSLQGVSLSGIVTSVPGEGGVKNNPVIQCLDRLKELDSHYVSHAGSAEVESESVQLFEKMTEMCSLEGSGNAAIATRNGALEVVCSFCSKIPMENDRALNPCLKLMALLLHDIQSTETFRSSGGPAIVVDILGKSQNLSLVSNSFAVVAAAATGNEVLKESFVELKIDEIILRILSDSEPRKGSMQSLYDAIRVLLTADDNRVVASQVYGYARKFAKGGIAGALVTSLHEGLRSPSLISACVALKAIAVNDEICKYIAENGGIDALLRCIDDSGEQGNKSTAKVCCSLLSKLAGSDANKNSIVEKRGLDRLIRLSTCFSDDPTILQEVMSIISVLCLRLPDNAARAMEAGAGDLAVQAMQKFPSAQQMQRNCCLMIRNLVVRNAENRSLLLSSGIEKYIRRAKQNHEVCKDAATDALRDLGLDDYNS